MIQIDKDGNHLCIDDDDPSRRMQVLAGAQDRDEKITSFFAASDGPVPKRVSMVQARVALTLAGLMDQVNAAVASADAATKIAWEYATELNRASPTLAAVQAAIGMTDEEADNLFRQAAGIVV